jgi:hypothetical protein
MDSAHAIELTPAAAAQLGIATDGSAAVRVRRVNLPESERSCVAARTRPSAWPRPSPAGRASAQVEPQRPRALAKGDDAPAPVCALAAKPAPKLANASKPKALPVSPTAATPPRGYVPSVPAPGSSGRVLPHRARSRIASPIRASRAFRCARRGRHQRAPWQLQRCAIGTRGRRCQFPRGFAVEATVHQPTPHGVKPAVTDPVAPS